MVTSTQPTTVMAKVREIITDDPHSWDEAWKQNLTPWDFGRIQPPLKEVTQSGELALPTHGRAFIPGCGSGHDAIYIASELGLDCLAIDVSTIAVQNASKNLSDSVKARFEIQDFFSFSVPDDQKFDLIYDYTFFVAIPPPRRAEWGKQMNNLIKPGGYLITLVFPLDPESDVGPPWFVRPEHYLAPLGDGWEKIVDRVPKCSSETHVGRERLVVWKKL
ncbi:S-adenosyl-L-methionine-dependent methyltransferase [Favolaschia claudopus]|uniref:S-adenosyl-L-methionine-dependent methyltransferase n=1 Tax=Favolaschia claudopus TaxID=2862362 RepID=A0AAW0D6K2_9AGAR